MRQYYNAKTCSQAPGDIAAEYVLGEECLYLNIWRADDATTQKKPVMVWIHGGAYEVGGTADPNYECHNFVEENPDVIVVCVGYRLGVLGFFHLSHLSDGKDYPDAQNLGLLDQMMALKWVHENIAAFGGDPDNVTIWGESAGAGCCTMLPLIEGTQKYYKRVIAQSGTPGQTRTPEEAIRCTDEMMKALGCKTVCELLAVSAEKLAETWGRLYGLFQVLGIRTAPERDGKILPLNTWEAYANGAAKDVVFLQGCNKDEFNTFVPPFGVEGFIEWAKQRKQENFAKFTDEEKALAESYCQSIKEESYEPYARLFGQMLFIAPQIRLSEEQTKAGGKAYTYYFTTESALPIIKAGHAIRSFGRIQTSGGHLLHGKGTRRDLLQDHAQDVGAVRQDRQSVAHGRAVARRQGKGVAPLRPEGQISSYVNVTLMFAGQFKSLVSVDYNLSAYLSDSVIDDATLLDTAGRWYAAAEYLGDTCYAIDVMLLLFGLSQQHLCLLV